VAPEAGFFFNLPGLFNKGKKFLRQKKYFLIHFFEFLVAAPTLHLKQSLAVQAARPSSSPYVFPYRNVYGLGLRWHHTLEPLGELVPIVDVSVLC
tara:strand:- start:753 stop:1037 length:285 start_codon:yes stop_codon:yes gene_type:complete